MATKKKFIDIELPLIDTTTSILGTNETLIGRTIKMDLTRKLRGKSLEVVFQIFEKDGKLIGLPKELNLMKFYIIRMMRKRASYVEDSFDTNCKDVKVSIKPFLIARKRISRAVRNNLRNTAREFILNYVKDKDYLTLCNELLSGQFQKEMLPKLKKVYPLSFCEIRIFETKEIAKVEYTPVKRQEKTEVKQEEVQDNIPEEKEEPVLDQFKEIEDKLKEAEVKEAAPKKEKVKKAKKKEE